MREQDILERLPGLLKELAGIPPGAIRASSSHEADAIVQWAGRTLVIEIKANARSGVIANAAAKLVAAARKIASDAVPLLVVPYMGEVGQRICKENGVAYADLAGNADISAPPLIIRIQGRPNPRAKSERSSPLFAPKSSRVARLMLLDPDRWWSQQELVQAGELSRGYVSRICSRLADEELVERNAERELRPIAPDILFRAWQEEYRFDKHEILRGHISARTGEELASRAAKALSSQRVPYALTGLAAAWLLAPFASFRLVTVFVGRHVDSTVLDSLGWHEGAKGANLWIVRPRDDGVFHGSLEIGGLRCVSAVQAALDLKAMPERAEEAAEHLQRKLLPWA